MEDFDTDPVYDHQMKIMNNKSDKHEEQYLNGPRYAYLQNRLSTYKTHQEKTKYNEDPLNSYDMGNFYKDVLNDRGPESLTIDDIQRDPAYIRSQVMNLREYGQRSNIYPFLNEVQLYETTRDPRGTENIPTDRQRAEMFKNKLTFYKRNLYPDVGSQQLTEQVGDFLQRDYRYKVQDESKKRAPIFGKEVVNFNNMAGFIMRDQSKNEALTDQIVGDNQYQLTYKTVTWNDINDTNLNSRTTPDHQILVADYRQVYISNPNQQPLNLLYYNQDEKENFEANKTSSQSQLSQVLLKGVQPKSHMFTESITNKIKGQQDKQIEVLMQLNKQQYQIYDQYCNKMQMIQDQLKDYNIRYNFIPKQIQQVTPQCIVELQIIEDFVVLTREMHQYRNRNPNNDKSINFQVSFEQLINQLAEQYLNNVKYNKQQPDFLKYLVLGNQDKQNSLFANNQKLINIQPDYLINHQTLSNHSNAPTEIQMINNQKVVNLQSDHSINYQTLANHQNAPTEIQIINKMQLSAYMRSLLSPFNQEQLQTMGDHKKQINIQQQNIDQFINRTNFKNNEFQFLQHQDPLTQSQTYNPLLSTLKPQGEMKFVTDTSITQTAPDNIMNVTRLPPKKNNKLMFDRQQEDFDKEIDQKLFL